MTFGIVSLIVAFGAGVIAAIVGFGVINRKKPELLDKAEGYGRK